VPCVSPPVDLKDSDDEEDNDDDDNDDEEDDNKDDNNDDDGDKEDDNNNDEEDTDDGDEEDVCDFDFNDVEGMFEYAMLRLQKIRRNEAKLASLGLIGGMTSAATPSTDRTNRKKCVKHVALKGDFVRRVQPKRNVFKPTSYKELDDPVINKRTCSINSSDTGEEDTGSKRTDKAEYSPEIEKS